MRDICSGGTRKSVNKYSRVCLGTGKNLSGLETVKFGCDGSGISGRTKRSSKGVRVVRTRSQSFLKDQEPKKKGKLGEDRV